MKKTFTFIVTIILLFGMLLSPAMPARASGAQPIWRTLNAPVDALSPVLRRKLASLPDDQAVTVIVELRQRAKLPRGKNVGRAEQLSGVIEALTFVAQMTQAPVKKFLDDQVATGQVKEYRSFWIFNGFTVTATPDTILEIATRPEVLSITPDEINIVPVNAPPAFANPEPNINLVNAPALWSMGYTGQGIVVATMDSGVNMSHAELSASWRGGSNSWYDPFGQHPSMPADISGHGTWVMGALAGGDEGGSSIGVAPGAQWIAVKMFNDTGGTTATAIHLGYQWLLNPDGNPATADAPHIVNNSWAYGYPGCFLDFEPDLQALRAAGILPIFAAGNGGPGAGTSYSPGNNPSAFAVGAINNNSGMYGLSSRGPTTCGGSTGVFPDLVAPGVNIYTTDLGGFYTTASGTSLAAPHVAGGLALLLSAYPNLTVAQQEAVLRSSAVDLGIAGPDDNFGYGRLNLLAAYQQLTGSATLTPTVVPTFTVSAMTETPTPLPTLTVVPSSPTALPTLTFTSVANTPTPLPTNTAIPASSTPLPTYTFTSIPNTPTPLPTNTAIPASSTPLPTYTFTSIPNTPTLLPTNTAIPASSTPLPTFTSLPATFTAFPTSTATSAPTTTQTSAPTISFHIGDLDRQSTLVKIKTWKATVTIRAHNASHQPLAGVRVYVIWTLGATGTTSCITNSNGVCSVTKTGMSTNTSSVTLTITSATLDFYTYDATANHDPDGDSNGTTILISKP